MHLQIGNCGPTPNPYYTNVHSALINTLKISSSTFFLSDACCSSLFSCGVSVVQSADGAAAGLLASTYCVFVSHQHLRTVCCSDISRHEERTAQLK